MGELSGRAAGAKNKHAQKQDLRVLRISTRGSLIGYRNNAEDRYRTRTPLSPKSGRRESVKRPVAALPSLRVSS